MAKRIYRIFIPALALILLLSGCGAYGPEPEAVWDAAGRETLQEAWEGTDWESLRKELDGAGWELPWEELDDADWETLWALWESADWEALLQTWEDTWIEAYPEDSKDHYYQILDGEGGLLRTVSDGEALSRLDDILCGGDIWAGPALVQEPGTPARTYVCYVERTLLAGEVPEAERAYREIIRFTVAQDQDTVTIQLLSGLGSVELLPWLDLGELLTVSVSVPAEAAETLRNPNQFMD